MIELTSNPIDVAAAVQAVRAPEAGAVVVFLGTARAMTGQRRTRSLDYEAYPEMARAKLTELDQQARKRWPLVECVVVHRLGHLELGEVCVAIAVSSAHREPAFEAGKWLIDRIKQIVPIWKRENWADGTSEWVHPDVEAAGPRQSASPTREAAASADQGETAP
jgi:molybdopterin synthase catalytic subunit